MQRVFYLSIISVMIFFLTSFSVNHNNEFNLQIPHAPDQLIAKFKPNLLAVETENVLNEIGAVKIDEFWASRAVLLKFNDLTAESDLYEKAVQLMKSGKVDYVEANIIIHLNSTIVQATPNDPLFKDQYALNNIGGPYLTADADIDALEAWKFTTGSKNVKVGIIDSGIDYTHPDLGPNLWINPGETGLDQAGRDKSTNGIDDDGNGYIDDYRGWNFVDDNNDPLDKDGHGSHCAGIIGAHGNDGIGITGVNWNVSLMALKAFSDGTGYLSAIVKAHEYAIKMGAAVTNSSYGREDSSSNTEFATIKKALEKGVLFVAAAGNSTSDNDNTPVYPASYQLDNVISVAATEGHDQLEDFSNFGKISVHLAAPGGGILSTIPGNKYEMWGGTSMAAPHVVGVAALMKSLNPNLTAVQMRKIILGTVDKKSNLSGKVITEGRLNAFEALKKVNSIFE